MKTIIETLHLLGVFFCGVWSLHIQMADQELILSLLRGVAP